MNAKVEAETKQGTGPNWLGRHPIAGSVVITVLTGVGLQLTHLIDFQDRIADVVGWTLRLRFIDFGFRMVCGVVVVLVVLPWLFGYLRHRPWLARYLRHMRLTAGPIPRLTIAVTAASVFLLAALMIGVGAAADGLEISIDSWTEDARWFVVILALIPGVWEELAFRGLMLSNLQQGYRPWPAIAITAVLFGSMHFLNLVKDEPSEVVFVAIMATTIGVAWGYLTVKTGSVIPAMALHYAINVLIELTLDPDLSDSASAAVFASITIVYPIMTIIATWLLTRWMGRRPVEV